MPAKGTGSSRGLPALRIVSETCVQVNIINKLMLDPISIHYHGILQTGSPWEDGTAHLSECPVLPGASRTHVFKADVPGTFWYHR
jgi:FtsP/CotA-like multicopper oxidase with cupredoxin domain